MMVRGTRRFASGAAIALVILTLWLVYYGPNNAPITRPPGSHLPQTQPGAQTGAQPGDTVQNPVAPGLHVPKEDEPYKASPANGPDTGKMVDPPAVNPPQNPQLGDIATTTAAAAVKPTFKPETPSSLGKGLTQFVKDTHKELFSMTTSDGRYWMVDYSPWPTYNPNFVPHPKKNDTWITVAQYHKTEKDNQIWFTQVVCEAQFTDTALKCTHPPWIVPIPPTWSEKCEGEISHFNFNLGPHDARVFWGGGGEGSQEDKPYILYGTQSQFSCFGQYFQDFSVVSDWPGAFAGKWRSPTEIQRPPPYKYSQVEKNWFLFWDINGQAFAHHDIFPKRVFGKLNDDGSVDKDLTQLIADQEDACLKRLIPFSAPTYAESIHQATNSLMITMCNRADPSCKPTEKNTFIFNIFHWKSFYQFHGLYEPLVHVFSAAAPYATYGVSKKPLWFRGRRLPGQWREKGEHGWDQTEMVYTTSLAWKEHGMKYHGYLDDVLLIGFGIEDKESGGLDILASEILGDLELNRCDDPTAQAPEIGAEARANA